ncbi:prolipoprotein diacylglyceryl transferase [Phaeovulum vinaykumarii]|uniref:Phosphatidylglycerol--prolipoprotein diacylglyceryl transferase n=1 Tax=Phaeovulum vinaykumarii TaxID=407234 RepID=A0A1N7MF44_9RHOB|nr:prolipoprotein diacylglyceryl transferase [Phaeovulum vinaykumarii]SIS84662.1 Prolipoprotein diacylglyceryl transferase [Phaeovulum vinaykumarii]SOC11882.1 prolipoprotein diacylglyceryl transferase [Phaeovulum vinaykumarii]
MPASLLPALSPLPFAALNFPDLAPEVFALDLGFMTFALRWYALAYIAGLVIGWRLVIALMNRPAIWGRPTAPVAPARIDDLLTAVVLGVILGGRLGYVLIYQPGYYLSHPLEILAVWQGGMSFHGGFAGVILAGLWFARRDRVPALSLADAMAAVAPVGLFFGRLANFINAELWGRPTDLPWGVIFPGAAAQACPGPAGLVDGLCARHPSQLYEAGLEGLALGVVLWVLIARGALRAPGRVLGVFLIGYGAARFVVEFVRQADAQFITPDNPLGHVLALGPLGVSMGQLLSLPMILAGLVFVLRARKGAA